MTETTLENWKPIPGYEGLYSASDLGQIRRDAKYLNSKDAPLKQSMGSGYLGVSLSRNSTPKRFLVHRLVCDAFIGLTDDLVVNHKNGIKTDNRLCNLELVSRAENERHKWSVLKTGAMNLAKLNQQEADDIRRLYASGTSVRELVDLYGVVKTSIGNVIHNRTWINK